MVATMATEAASETAANCDGRLVYVDDPSAVGDNYPLIMKTRRNLYVMRGKCFRLSGNEFRGSITFFTYSRAREGFNGTYGVLAVKSLRTFNIPTQSKKIKLTRTKGWYLPNGSQMVEQNSLDDFPISTSIADWNAMHTPPTPPELFDGLDVKWHAYPIADKLDGSTAWGDFWKESSNDFSNRVVTNYLLRFTINPEKGSQVPVPFYVMTPSSVERIDLSVESNIGSLTTTYIFILE
jgi:hypothetical protein